MDINNVKPTSDIDNIKPQLELVGQSSSNAGTILNTTTTLYEDVTVTYNSINQIYADFPSSGLNNDMKPQLLVVENL